MARCRWPLIGDEDEPRCDLATLRDRLFCVDHLLLYCSPNYPGLERVSVSRDMTDRRWAPELEIRLGPLGSFRGSFEFEDVPFWAMEPTPRVARVLHTRSR